MIIDIIIYPIYALAIIILVFFFTKKMKKEHLYRNIRAITFLGVFLNLLLLLLSLFIIYIRSAIKNINLENFYEVLPLSVFHMSSISIGLILAMFFIAKRLNKK
jgi:NADH:ubiquinone oxidoreductase subunit 5 (subunit L)/multisubunit Na+/H+ antiporter MnhA subunit